MGFFYDAVYYLFFFGRNRLSSSETTKTPATAFPLNMSPTALENPSTASDPCNSSIFMSRFKAPVHTAVVAPVVSAADTR